MIFYGIQMRILSSPRQRLNVFCVQERPRGLFSEQTAPILLEDGAVFSQHETNSPMTAIFPSKCRFAFVSLSFLKYTVDEFIQSRRTQPKQI